MRTAKKQGGAGLKPSVYTYTGAMRAALVGNLPERALQVEFWTYPAPHNMRYQEFKMHLKDASKRSSKHTTMLPNYQCDWH